MADCVVRFTKVVHKNGPLSKRFVLKAGQLEKSVVAAFTEGYFETVPVHGAAGFADYIRSLQPNEALCFSRCHAADAGRLTTQKNLTKVPGSVARTKQFFSFKIGEPGWLTLDHDPAPNAKLMSREELWSILCEVIPNLQSAGIVWWPSAGSCICHGEQELIGIRGQRFWIMVADAGDIPRAGKVLLERLWLKRFGRIEVSKSGSLLERSLFDGAVWDAARLDFVGGSIVEPPLEQRRGEPVVLADGCPLDTRLALPDLTEDEKKSVADLIAQAKEAAEPERQVIKARYDQARSGEITERLIRQGVSQSDAAERAAHAVSQAGQGVLLGDWIIHVNGAGAVSVAEILRNKAKYDGAECCDPLEPTYQGNKVCAKLYLFGQRPVIHSFAHGATTYRLYPQPQKLILAPRDSENVQRLNEVVDLFPDLFSLGSSLATVSRTGLRTLTPLSVVYQIAAVFACWKLNAKGDQLAADYPERAAKMLLEGDLSAWRPIRGVVTAPFMALDGRIVDQPGYDAESKLYLSFAPHEFPPVPDRPTMAQVLDAFRVLWRPFSCFPFASAEDRGAMVAALLTAVMRWVMRIAPGFMFEAPSQASGKTLAAECVKSLATGTTGSGVWPADEAELRKMLVSWVREGRLCHIFDNITGRFSSGTLAAAMTSEALDGVRLLGTNSAVTGDLMLLWLATGNNASLDRDLAERWIRLRIDPQCERPSERVFKFNPLFEVQANRPEMVVAALTILRAWHCAGRPDRSKRGCRFAEWSATVRACVLWLAQELSLAGEDVTLADPAASLFDSTGDAETEELAAFLSILHGLVGAGLLEAAFSASDLIKLAELDCDVGQEVAGWLGARTHKPKLTPQSARSALANIRDRCAGGYRLRLAAETTKRRSALWNVEEVTGM